MLDEQPVGSLAAGPVALHPHQHPAAAQALAVQCEFKVTLGQGRLGRPVAFRLPIAAVPELHRAAAILTLRNRPFEIAIVQRVILDLDREALVGGIKRRTARDRP